MLIFRPNDLALKINGQPLSKMNFLMRTILLDIARAGILAPSADNRHVFRIEINETSLCLWPTTDFAATTERHRRVLGLISLGAVVENMMLRAGELGLGSHANWFPAGSDAGPIVQFNLQDALTEIDDGLAAAIPDRHTNRRMYRGPTLSVSETNLLSTAVASVEGTQLIWLKGDARRHALKLIWQAESERFLRQRLHEELFSSIRFDLSWRETADSALPPGSLEIEPPMRPLFKALRHWGLMRPLTFLGVHRLIGLRAGWLPCWQAPTLGLLLTTLPIEAGAVAVGAAFERLWLRATLLDLALQPLAAATVLPLQSTSDFGASDELRLALTLGWQTIAPEGTPLMVFRMGRAAPPKIKTGRQPIDLYTLKPITKKNG